MTMTTHLLPPAPHVQAGLETVTRFYGLQPQPATLGERQVLDFGCGEGRNTRLLAELGFTAVGIDSDPAAIRRASAIDYRAVKAGKLAYSIGSKLDGLYDEPTFRGIVCNEVLHMMGRRSNQQHLISKLMSITLPGGFNILSTYVGPTGNGTTVKPVLPGMLREAYDKRGWTVIQCIEQPYSETVWGPEEETVVNSIGCVIAIKP